MYVKFTNLTSPPEVHYKLLVNFHYTIDIIFTRSFQLITVDFKLQSKIQNHVNSRDICQCIMVNNGDLGLGQSLRTPHEKNMTAFRQKQVGGVSQVRPTRSHKFRF